jgi:Glutaredoxin-like domain (DUF836)
LTQNHPRKRAGSSPALPTSSNKIPGRGFFVPVRFDFAHRPTGFDQDGLKFMHLILYSKVGCHLCEGLEQKLRSILRPNDQLEIREITSNSDWWNAYQYEIPVLYMVKGEQENILPRLSPRASVTQLQEMLQRHL